MGAIVSLLQKLLELRILLWVCRERAGLRLARSLQPPRD